MDKNIKIDAFYIKFNDIGNRKCLVYIFYIPPIFLNLLFFSSISINFKKYQILASLMLIGAP